MPIIIYELLFGCMTDTTAVGKLAFTFFKIHFPPLLIDYFLDKKVGSWSTCRLHCEVCVKPFAAFGAMLINAYSKSCFHLLLSSSVSEVVLQRTALPSDSKFFLNLWKILVLYGWKFLVLDKDIRQNKVVEARHIVQAQHLGSYTCKNGKTYSLRQHYSPGVVFFK